MEVLKKIKRKIRKSIAQIVHTRKQKLLGNEAMRKMAINFYSVFNPKSTLTGKVLIEPEKISGYVNSLKTRGIVELGHLLPENEIDKIYKFCRELYFKDGYEPSLGKFKIGESIPEKMSYGHYETSDMIKSTLIMDIANDPGLIAIAQEIIGGKPTIRDVNLYWSFPRQVAKGSQKYHRDWVDWKYITLFIYLNDVDETNGAHIYVQNTLNSPKLREKRHFEDAEIESSFPAEDVLVVKGKKGSAFIIDNWGLHKGSIPEAKERFVLAVVYSMYGKFSGIQKISNPSNYDKYTNRYFYS